MTRRISLSVNDVPIQLDYYVAEYIYHIVGGIIASLHNTGEIEHLKLEIDNRGQVAIDLNRADVPLKDFPIEIIRHTIFGMIAPLKGVAGEISRLELTIDQ